MKRLWRPVCVWLLGHDWTYWYAIGSTWYGTVVPVKWAATHFSHQECHRCLDRIG